MDRQQILFLVAHRSVERQLCAAIEDRYQVMVTSLRREALQLVERRHPDLILIDMPSIRFDIARFFESFAGVSVATLLLLGKGMRLDQMPLANGYLRYPFSTQQLMRRLARVISAKPQEIVEWRGLCVDTENLFLIWKSQQVPITRKQADLALAFLDSPDQVITREQLMRDVWGTDFMGDTRTLDVHIHWLRKALRQTEAPFVLETRRGVGYCLTTLYPSGQP
ncbi:MAG: response regulator transcription factor [Anaerolineae bacterium]|nr:response regulator transcription factor [Anaerolineae bacterium]